MKNSIYLLALLLAVCSSLFSQDLYVDVQCSNSYPGVGEQIKLSYSLKLKMQNGMASISHSGIKIKKPTFSKLSIIDEGSESSGFSFGSSFGGDMLISKYSFILQPTEKGKVTVGAFTFIMNGKEYTSKQHTITVGEGDPNVTIVPQNSNLFVRIETAKNELYEGEHTLVTYKLYSHYSNISIQDADFPMQKGLWSEEIPAGTQGWPQTQENINGKGYMVIPLKKEILFARSSGTFELPALSLDIVIGGSMFSAGSKETIKSNSQTIKVKPLPSGAPLSFQNQAGSDYKMEVSYSTTSLKANEPLDISIKISGNGNLKLLEPFQLALPKDFEAYDPEIIDKTKLNANGISGSITFNYLVIPRHHGTFEFPALEFSYFDFPSKKYVTLSHPAQIITVSKGDGNAIVSKGATKTDVEIINNEIRHIHYDTQLTNASEDFWGSGLFYGLIGFPSALSLIVFVFLRKNNEKSDEVTSTKKLSKNALKMLAGAQSKLDSKDDKGFYEVLYKGLQDYLCKSLEIPLSLLTDELLKQNLELKKVDQVVINNLFILLEESKMARFSPTSVAGAQETLNSTIDLIKTIERYVKK